MKENTLNNAISKEDIEKVQSLINNGADIECVGTNGHTPLMQSAEIENIEIAQFLIEQGANVNRSGHQGATPLHIAVDTSIDSIIQSGAASGDEPLEMICFLLNNGADINLKDIKGKSALNWAENYQSQKVIMTLLNN